MKTHISYLLAIVIALGACASPSEPVMNDGVAETNPVGTNVKSRTVYRRGGSSSSVKILSRENLEDEGATADDILRPD